ncbi:MAG: iron-containing alcohol dehydrogenase, partial [Gammaproteobacteria bacterium]|nr:iron-containing alcohol dehydrogenase [Gammaproteobacteria bacterium]
MTREFIEPGAVRHLPTVLAELDARRVVLVAGDQAYKDSGAWDVLEPILERYQVTRFAEFTHNPKLEEALSAVARLRDASPDVVLAVGGGSTLDMAKLVNILAH